MSTYLSALIPSSVVAWYPLADVTAAGNITTVTDASGNGRHLAGPASNKPTYVLSGIGTRPVIRFSGSDDPLTFTPSSGTLNIKDMVILTKYAPASGSVFTDFNGLVSNTANDDPMLIGDSGTGKFYDYDPPAPADNAYRKDWTFFAETNMQAPINTFGAIQYSQTGGQNFNSNSGLQIGKDRNFAARTWKGDIADMMFFSTVLSADERRRVKLYLDLKFNRWLSDSTALEFPSPDITGIPWARHRKIPRDWSKVTIVHTYEDDGRSFSDTSDTPPQSWEVGYTGLTQAEAQVFDAFWEAVRLKRSFSFTDKDGTLHTGVRVAAYDRNHEAHMSWNSTVNFTLVKYY